MAYHEDLADRIRAVIEDPSGLTEKRMFGGHAFLVNGSLAISASGQGGLLVRVDPAESDTLVSEDTVTRFEMRGREMNGWLYVAASAATTEEQVSRWVETGLGYARSLPAKRLDGTQ